MGGQGVESAVADKSQAGRRFECKPEDVPAYVCDITGDLRKLALSADLTFLAYLIDMVHIEAFNVLNARSVDKSRNSD